MRQLVLIAHNVRSAHNVGSLLRTGEGLGVARIVLTGYTPYPLQTNDARLPHIAERVNRQISKTALGADKQAVWSYTADPLAAIAKLKKEGYTVAALEQAPGALGLPGFTPPDKIALIVGREVEGLEPEILAAADRILEIPMFGHKESYNVAAAAAMALYHLRFA